MKETQILDAFRQLEERQGSLLLFIGVVNSRLLSTVDEGILDLSSSAQDALREMPNIRQSLEDISYQIRELGLSEQLYRKDQQCLLDNSSVTTAVELALSSQQSPEESMSLLELANAVPVSSQMLRPTAELIRTLLQDGQRRQMNTSEKFIGSSGTATHRGQAAEKIFLVPVSCNPLFTGRARIFNEMKHFYLRNDRLEQKRLVLTGLGGVRKTQIATAFTYEAYASESYSVVLWVFAINKQELMKSFTQIAKSLGLYPEVVAEEDNDSPDRIAPSVLALLRWLSRSSASKWLSVFDNVDDLDSFDVSAFLPKVP